MEVDQELYKEMVQFITSLPTEIWMLAGEADPEGAISAWLEWELEHHSLLNKLEGDINHWYAEVD